MPDSDVFQFVQTETHRVLLTVTEQPAQELPEKPHEGSAIPGPWNCGRPPCGLRCVGTCLVQRGADIPNLDFDAVRLQAAS